MSRSSCAVVLVLLGACGRGGTKDVASQPNEPAATTPSSPPPTTAADGSAGSAFSDPTLARDRAEYVADVVAFTPGTTAEDVRARMTRGSKGLQEEWMAWEQEGAMTNERITAFYKQTTNYIYELAEWHLWVAGKRESDMQLVEDMRKAKPKNILDFGGGTGLMAIPLARAGFDVTLADLDSTTLKFAIFRAEQHKIPLKVWKSDVDAAPPDKKYDVIMALDVLEHLPRAVLDDVVEKLVALKHKHTQIIISAPFGRTAVHPMHLDADEHTKAQVDRLMTALPPDAQ